MKIAAQTHRSSLGQTGVVMAPPLDGTNPRPAARRPIVLIMQRRMTHYRVPMFEQLRTTLDRHGVDLRVTHGEALPAEQSKGDGGQLEWAGRMPTRYAFGGRLCWQNAIAAARNADLVIVTQENRLLFNYLLPSRRLAGRWALWGHGRNFQPGPLSMASEALKRWFLRQPDWWFAYTGLSADIVRQAGYPAERVTVLNNALDMQSLRNHLAAIGPESEAGAMRALGIGPGRVGLMIGSLYTEKRIGFALAAARLIREKVPDFQLVVVGDGPLRPLVEKAVETAQAEGGWIRWLGVRSGAEKAALLRRADLLINPGLIGLVMLDSFVVGTPVVTCNVPDHSPEVAYLQHGVNGWIAPPEVEAYATAVSWLLHDERTRSALREGCLRDGHKYTLEAMVERFAEGIVRCLAAAPRDGARRKTETEAAS